MLYASQRSVVRRGLDTIKNARGEKTTDLEGLALDDDYEQRLFADRRKARA
jgi:twitching motility protein PilT